MTSVEKKYNIIIDGQNIFDQPAKNNIKTNNKILKITTAQGDDYTAGYLLFYPYLNMNIIR